MLGQKSLPISFRVSSFISMRLILTTAIYNDDCSPTSSSACTCSFNPWMKTTIDMSLTLSKCNCSASNNSWYAKIEVTCLTDRNFCIKFITCSPSKLVVIWVCKSIHVTNNFFFSSFWSQIGPVALSKSWLPRLLLHPPFDEGKNNSWLVIARPRANLQWRLASQSCTDVALLGMVRLLWWVGWVRWLGSTLPCEWVPLWQWKPQNFKVDITCTVVDSVWIVHPHYLWSLNGINWCGWRGLLVDEFFQFQGDTSYCRSPF